MPFVRRDETGRIAALLRSPAPDATEHLPPDDPEVATFLTEEAAGSEKQVALRQSDLDIIRVVEDLVDVLLDKKLILLTDLPQPAQEKLMRRKRLRASLASIGDVIAVDEDDIL